MQIDAACCIRYSFKIPSADVAKHFLLDLEPECSFWQTVIVDRNMPRSNIEPCKAPIQINQDIFSKFQLDQVPTPTHLVLLQTVTAPQADQSKSERELVASKVPPACTQGKCGGGLISPKSKPP